MMRDITNKRLLYAKGLLFLLGGVMASAFILWENPSLRLAFLLAIAIWCFARFYYFTFYVIEHYIDQGYRFSGLWSFARYMFARSYNRKP